MDKEVVEQIRENKRKKKTKKTSKKTLTVVTTNKRLVERQLVNQQQVNFNATWSSSIIRKVGNKFHYNFKASL
jgi:hypothetical protein